MRLYDSIIMKMKMNMKKRSHKQEINRPKPRHGHKYSKYKWLSMIMLICIKQHLSNIWSSIHEKVKQHRDWFEKRVDYIKKACISIYTSSQYNSQKWQSA